MHRRVLVLMHKNNVMRLGPILNDMVEHRLVEWDWFVLGGRYTKMIPVSNNAKNHPKPPLMAGPFEDYSPYEDLQHTDPVLRHIKFVDVCKLNQLRFDIIAHLVGGLGYGAINSFAEAITDISYVEHNGKVHLADEVRSIVCEDDECLMNDIWCLVQDVARSNNAKNFVLCTVDAHY